MEQVDNQQKAAENLMGQFINAGLVQQEDDGNFVVVNDANKSKFKPFN